MEHQKEGFSGLSAVCDQEEMKNTHLGIPEVTDCSSDTIPVGTESTAGTKKVQVPDLISMWKYLLNKNYANRRLSFYSNLNYMLKSGELSRIVGFKVLNRVINKEAMKLVNRVWRQGLQFVQIEALDMLGLDNVVSLLIYLQICRKLPPIRVRFAGVHETACRRFFLWGFFPSLISKQCTPLCV